MKKYTTRKICRMAIMTALYVLLTLLSVRAGNLRITFASLPVVVSALLFGPWESVGVALMGEFLNQLLSYGLTATTPLWLIPPAVRGLMIGLVAVAMWKTDKMLEERPVAFYLICAGAALATSVCNTAVIWVDSMIYHYYTFAYVFGDLLVRIGTGLLTAVLVATVAMPLTRILCRQKIAGENA